MKPAQNLELVSAIRQLANINACGPSDAV